MGGFGGAQRSIQFKGEPIKMIEVVVKVVKFRNRKSVGNDTEVV